MTKIYLVKQITTFHNPYSNFFRRQPKTNWQLTKKENKSQGVKNLKKHLNSKKEQSIGMLK